MLGPYCRSSLWRELSWQEVTGIVAPDTIAYLKARAQDHPFLLAHERACAEIRLGMRMYGDGYNICVIGASGTGKRTTLQYLLKDFVPRPEQMWDIAYAYNFVHPHEPQVLQFPAGEGMPFATALRRSVNAILNTAQDIVKSDAFLRERRTLLADIETRECAELSRIEAELYTRGFRVRWHRKRGTYSFDLVPLLKGKDSSFEALHDLASRAKLSRCVVHELHARYRLSCDEVSSLLHTLRTARRAARRRLAQYYRARLRLIILEQMACIKKRVACYAPVFSPPPVSCAAEQTEREKTSSSRLIEVPHEFEEMRARIISYIERIQTDVQVRVQCLMSMRISALVKKRFFDRYTLNFVCVHTEHAGYVFTEHQPNLANLCGSIESKGNEGDTLENGHLRIRAGALHRAHAGVLIVQLEDLLAEEEAWTHLKRALRTKQVLLPAGSSQSQGMLRPEGVPLTCKLVLVGEPCSFERLSQEDSSFRELFKVCAEFDTSMPNSDKNQVALIAYLDRVVARYGTFSLDSSAYARLLAYAEELAESHTRLSTSFVQIADLVLESHAVAVDMHPDVSVITAHVVQEALNRRQYVCSRARERFQRMIACGELLVEVQGYRIGRINALAIEEHCGHSFGIVISLTAQASAGKEGVMNIEREAGLSGEIYDKAHLIITSLLREKCLSAFADAAFDPAVDDLGKGQDSFPLCLSAALCFEQSYHGIDGDSASAAEFLVLLSAIGRFPLRQDRAITGSVNQLGQVQAIGGVSEKISGFYDVCALNGLTGMQGVLIPKSSCAQLFLPERVQDAVRAGTFHVWAVCTIDDALELMVPDDLKEQGSAQLYQCVRARLRDFYVTVKGHCE